MGFIQPMPDEDQEEYMKKTTNWIATFTTVVALAGFVLLSVSAQAQTDGEALYKVKMRGLPWRGRKGPNGRRKSEQCSGSRFRGCASAK